jgi:hypothetical protein
MKEMGSAGRNSPEAPPMSVLGQIPSHGRLSAGRTAGFLFVRPPRQKPVTPAR